jgi:transcriptional antiterminator
MELAAFRGKGILLTVGINEKNRLLREIGVPVAETPEESPHSRREMILKEMLLHTGEMTSIQKLSDLYYVGRTSIVNDMRYVEDRLKQYNLRLKKTKEGTCIEGSEEDIRKAIAGLAIGENTRKGLLEFFEREEIEFVEGLLYAAEKKEWDMDDIYYTNLLIHILISIKRVRGNLPVSGKGGDSEWLPDIDIPAYYRRAKEIAEKIDEHYHIRIGEGETYYIYRYLTSLGYERSILKQQIPDAEPDICVELARKLTCRLSRKFQIDFGQDEDMMQGLILHLRPMLHRLQYNIRIDNPLKEEISTHYPEMVADCRKNLEELMEEYHFPAMSADEIVNIAIYYQTMLEKIAMRKKVVVVCHSGYGTSQLLAAKLKNEFAFLEIAEVVSTRKIREMDLTGVDFLIATVPVEREGIPCVVVSSLLTEQDIRAIRSHIMKRETAKRQEGTDAKLNSGIREYT